MSVKDRAEVNDLLDWLERLAVLEGRARQLDIRAGTGGKAEAALLAWRADMRAMVEGPMPAEEVEEMEGEPTVAWMVLPKEAEKPEGKDLTGPVPESTEEGTTSVPAVPVVEDAGGPPPGGGPSA